jgi:hypothetical protein
MHSFSLRPIKRSKASKMEIIFFLGAHFVCFLLLFAATISVRPKKQSTQIPFPPRRVRGIKCPCRLHAHRGSSQPFISQREDGMIPTSLLPC